MNILQDLLIGYFFGSYVVVGLFFIVGVIGSKYFPNLIRFNDKELMEACDIDRYGLVMILSILWLISPFFPIFFRAGFKRMK